MKFKTFSLNFHLICVTPKKTRSDSLWFTFHWHNFYCDFAKNMASKHPNRVDTAQCQTENGKNSLLLKTSLLKLPFEIEKDECLTPLSRSIDQRIIVSEMFVVTSTSRNIVVTHSESVLLQIIRTFFIAHLHKTTHHKSFVCVHKWCVFVFGSVFVSHHVVLSWSRKYVIYSIGCRWKCLVATETKSVCECLYLSLFFLSLCACAQFQIQYKQWCCRSQALRWIWFQFFCFQFRFYEHIRKKRK